MLSSIIEPEKNSQAVSQDFDPLSVEELILLNIFRQEHADGYNIDWMSAEKAEYLQTLMIRDWLNSTKHKDYCVLMRAKIVKAKKDKKKLED